MEEVGVRPVPGVLGERSCDEGERLSAGWAAVSEAGRVAFEVPEVAPRSRGGELSAARVDVIRIGALTPAGRAVASVSTGPRDRPASPTPHDLDTRDG